MTTPAPDPARAVDDDRDAPEARAAAQAPCLDDLSTSLLTRETVRSVLHEVAERAVRSVPGAVEASVTLVERGRASSASWTGLLAYELDEAQYESEAGPCLTAALTGEIQAIPDMVTERRWPHYNQMAVQRGCLSSLSLPIHLAEGLRAGLNLYSTSIDAFDPHAQELAVVLAGRASTAIQNMHGYERVLREAENLRTALQSRAGMEQAKGVLMGRHGISADEAFALLASRSQHDNRKLRDLAAELLDALETGPVQAVPS